MEESVLAIVLSLLASLISVYQVICLLIHLNHGAVEEKYDAADYPALYMQ